MHLRFAWTMAVALGPLLAGCGGILYAVNMAPAAGAIEEAEAAGAAEHAPYEYYYARAHLDKAREDAAEAAYQDAIANAELAEQFGIKARDLARRQMREAGR